MKQKIDPFIYGDEMVEIVRNTQRGLLYEIHISDLHFGTINAKTEYEILRDQFINKIITLPKIDIISVNGDLFDHKLLSNSDAVLYASLFVDDLCKVARQFGATLILIDGTPSHECGQLKLFYHYLNDPTLDIRIITNIQFVYTHGATILCIPELHGVDESIYRHYLYHNYCDQVFGHMTFKGAVFGDNVGTGRLFCIEDFLRCRGPIISGHVHKPGCFEKDFYYCGSPMRYKFGEEEPKGFIICIMDLDRQRYYVDFEEITSFRYDTIELTDIISNDPKKVIDYINDLKERQNIDFLKIKFKYVIDGSNKTIITNFYRNRNDIKLEFYDVAEEAAKKLEQEQQEQATKYSFITDNKLSDYEKFVRYVNIQEGYDFISVDALKQILMEDI